MDLLTPQQPLMQTTCGNRASFGWGMPAEATVSGAVLSNWTHDNFGEDLLLNIKNGGIFYWDRTAGTAARAVALSSLSGSNLAPTVAKQIMVSDQDRHIIAFGCDARHQSGHRTHCLYALDHRKVYLIFKHPPQTQQESFESQAVRRLWWPYKPSNKYWYLQMSPSTVVVLGPPFTFGLTEISRNITIAGPNAAVAVNDFVFWMGSKEFYVYGGTCNDYPVLY